MFGFIFFNAIRKVSSELTAARLANFIMNSVPRRRFTHHITDAASLWIHQETSYKNCWECFNFVIDKGRSDIHPSCYEQWLKWEQEAFEEERLLWWQLDMERDAEEVPCQTCEALTPRGYLTSGICDDCLYGPDEPDDFDAAEEAAYNATYNKLIQ